MTDFSENVDHRNLQNYYENWLNQNPRFTFSEYTYHVLCEKQIVSRNQDYVIKRQNHDPTALIIRGIPDLFVTDKTNNLSFYIEFKGSNTQTIEPTALAYQYGLVKMGVKILYIYAEDKGFLLTSECIANIRVVYFHHELFGDKDVQRQKQHNFIKNNLNQDLNFQQATTNGKSLDPYVWFNVILQGAIVDDPKFLMNNLDVYD